MYVGHSLLAFTLGALMTRAIGADRSRALLVGGAAAGFALVPDVDSAYTIFAVIKAGPTNVFPTTKYVWTAEAWIVHRSLTHSLLIGTAATVAVWLYGAVRTRRRWTATRPTRGTPAAVVLVGILGILIGIGFATDGSLGIATTALYLVVALVIAELAIRRGATPIQTGSAAAVGLLTHPFGDVFMGRPPAFLYPLWTAPPIEKVTVATDPTVNLVALFGIELFLAWSALWVATQLTGRSLTVHLETRAALALVFAGAAFVIRPPTLDVAYHFALGTLATGVVLGVAPDIVGSSIETRSNAGWESYLTGVTTGLAAVSLAVVSYLVVYLVLSPV